MNRNRKIMTLAFVAAFAGGAVAAGDGNLKMSEWDSDNNGSVSLAEWDTAVEEHELFDKLDQDNSGTFDIQEASRSFMEYDIEMDLDDGGHIERQEFTVGSFNYFDKNDNDRLDEGEFSEFSDKAMGSPLLSSN